MPSGTFWGYKIVGLIHTFMHITLDTCRSTLPQGAQFSTNKKASAFTCTSYMYKTATPTSASTNMVKKGELGAQIHYLSRLTDACYCLKTLHYNHKEFKSLTARQRVDTFIHLIRHNPAHKHVGKSLHSPMIYEKSKSASIMKGTTLEKSGQMCKMK